MSEVQGLVVVPAYYLDPSSGQVVELRIENRLLASDFADKWNGFRNELRGTVGWEPFLSPPNDPQDPRSADGYTKAMFRTPEDQALVHAETPDLATPVDQGAHQAGRGFDLDLAGMQQSYPSYDYNVVAAAAAKFGLRNLSAASRPEPWHFDDDPAALFGSSAAAIGAIGNLSSQVNEAVANGMPRPEDLAIGSYNMRNLTLILAGLGAAYGVWMALQHHQNAARRLPAASSEKKGPEYAL